MCETQSFAKAQRKLAADYIFHQLKLSQYVKIDLIKIEIHQTPQKTIFTPEISRIGSWQKKKTISVCH